MDENMVTCPTCGESVPYARRCRKCAASLDSVPEPPYIDPDIWDGREATRYRIVLTPMPASNTKEIRYMPTRNPRHLKMEASREFELRFVDRSGQTPEKNITLPYGLKSKPARWHLIQRGAHTIFSAFFYINSAGHDLDMWLHYDLETTEFLGMHPGSETDSPDTFNIPLTTV